jgi:hypothetical protein
MEAKIMAAMTGVVQPLAEVFGYPIDNMSPAAQRARVSRSSPRFPASQ